jgi:LacI family transcriptional regulator, purine nucleotide synthesis repressor
MANIKDIAKLAGVSISTVSRVLNNHPYVSEEKRKKVETVIGELNFQQNLNAVHLVKGKTLTIGAIIPYIDHPYFQAIVGGIMESAFNHHYSVLCCVTNYDQDEELKYLQMLQRKQLDGLIICSHANDWETIMPYADYGPIISCERFEHVPCVYTDHYEAFTAGLNYLIQKGHRHIGYCTSREHSFSSEMRYMAFKKALANINQPIEDSWIFTDCYTMNDGKRIMKDLHTLNHIPTAIIANGDEVAGGMMVQAKLLGINVPEQLSIIGLHNEPLSEALDLTTIDLHIKEIGQQAFKLFYTGEKQKLKMPFQLVERNTVSHLF